MGARIGRKQYADMFGPTTGDLVRLADTELFIEIEKDFAVYGDEVKFGGGKVIRDGMGQSPAATRARRRPRPRHHQRRHPRPLGHRQGGYRDQGRQDMRHRQGGKPRPDGRGHSGHGRGGIDRGDCGRGADRDRGRDRYAHTLHLAPADRDRHRGRALPR